MELFNGQIPDADVINTLLSAAASIVQVGTAVPTDPKIYIWIKTDEDPTMQINIKCSDGWHNIIIGGKVA